MNNSLVPLNKINASRLLNRIERDVEHCLESFMFEPNIPATHAMIKASMNQYLSELQERQAVNGYQIVCDSTNNPPSSINNNQLNVTLMIQPTSSISVHTINATVSNSGAVYDDVPLYDYPYCEDY
jgi:phage tail sheath protein FI